MLNLTFSTTKILGDQEREELAAGKKDARAEASKRVGALSGMHRLDEMFIHTPAGRGPR